MKSTWTMREVGVLTSILLASAVITRAVSAQSTDPRWKSMLGCWSTTDSATITLSGKGDAGLLCVVPLSTGSGVVVATVMNGEVVNRENLDATGQHVATTRDGCPGWESATWSRDGHRLFLRSEFTCPGGSVRKGSGVFGMSPDAEWIQMQGVGVAGNSGVRARRFVPATDVSISYDTSNQTVTQRAAIGFSTQTARLGAAAPMFNDDVLELVKSVDGYVADAWLTELGQSYWLNAKELVRLSDAGLPSRTMDLMIALSNPKVFAIDKARPNDLTVRATNAYGSRPGNGTAAWGDVGMSRYSCYSEFDRMLGFGYYPMTFSDPSCYANGQYYRNARYGYNGYGYNAYGYNDGYYWGQTPVIIVNRGTGGTDGTYAPASPQGRAVNGQGYTRDRTSAGASASSSGGYSAPSGSSSSSGSSGSSSGSSGGSSSSGSSGSASGTSTGRTAVPRPPG